MIWEFVYYFDKILVFFLETGLDEVKDELILVFKVMGFKYNYYREEFLVEIVIV